MTATTRNRILTLTFILLVALLAGELSYYFSNHRTQHTLTPTPPPTTTPKTLPQTKSNPTSSTKINFNDQTINQLTQIVPKPLNYLNNLTLKIELQGKLTQVSSHSLTLSQSNQVPLTINFKPTTLSILQIITSQSPANSNDLQSLKLNAETTVTIIVSFQPQPTTKSVTIKQSIP